MNLAIFQLVACFIGTFVAVRSLLYNDVIINIGFALLAAYLTEAIFSVMAKAPPNKLIGNLSKKAVFITGCDSGFGKSLALQLDELGVKVYAGCLFPQGDGATELKELSSDLLQIVSLDVTKDAVVKEAAAFVEATLGNRVLWAVVNNAGVAAVTEVEWCPVETYRQTLDVNALGPIRVTQSFLPLLRNSNGRVVIVASLAGRYTFAGFTAYSMSKYAAVSFADGLRREMKKFGISVHTIEPTLYKTPISSEECILKNLQKTWEKCPESVQLSYGQDYFLDFEAGIRNHLRKAKPSHKIKEVIDALIDAVIGERPQSRYVPSLVTQLRVKVLSSLPTRLQDYVFESMTPKTPPASVKNKLPPLKNPYLDRTKKMRRMMSFPTREKAPIESLNEDAAPVRRFTFEDIQPEKPPSDKT